MADGTRDGAYLLGSPAAHAAYDDDWAATYDEDFADATGYTYPGRVAQVFLAVARPADEPVVDVACGTGLLGAALLGSGMAVDGLDISGGMLAQARAKGAYRDLRVTDLTLPQTSASYGAVVSSGAFTLGHLGTDVLVGLLGLGRPGALYVIGVNSRHFVESAFADVLATLASDSRITSVVLHERSVYDIVDDPDDPMNRATIVEFRLA